MKTRHFHTKLPCKKWMLSQTESVAQNGPNTKNGVFETWISLKLLFQCKNLSYKKLIWCINYPNTHIDTFRKRMSFIWGCFSPVSILNLEHCQYTLWIAYLRKYRFHIMLCWKTLSISFFKLCYSFLPLCVSLAKRSI